MRKKKKNNIKFIITIILVPLIMFFGTIYVYETFINKGIPSVEKLKKMGEQRLTLRELAEEFDVSISTIRTHLKKHNVISPEREECAIMKKYYSASNEKEKTQAFTEIDKILIPIAKEKYNIQKFCQIRIIEVA